MASKYYILYFTGRLEEVEFEKYVNSFDDETVRVLVEEETFDSLKEEAL